MELKRVIRWTGDGSMPWYSSTKRRVPKKQFKETKARGEGRAGVCKLHAEWNKANDKRNARTIARAHPGACAGGGYDS